MARRTAIDLDAVDPAALDLSVLDDLRRCLGTEQTDGLLALLAEELTERFGASSADPKQLAYEAHVMTSAAGALGFFGLSELCRGVEEACRAGHDPSLLLLRLVGAREVVIDKIEHLRLAGPRG